MERYWIVYILIGAGTGWLIAWTINRQLKEILKYIIFGAIGGLAGGFLIDILIRAFRDIAPMAGAVLGSLVLLAYLKKK